MVRMEQERKQWTQKRAWLLAHKNHESYLHDNLTGVCMVTVEPAHFARVSDMLRSLDFMVTNSSDCS